MGSVREWFRERVDIAVSRRRSRLRESFDSEIVSAITENISQELFPSLSASEVERLRTKWGQFLHKVAQLDGVEASGGNSVEILEAGTQTIASMIEAIDNAKTRVWLETYIFDGSEVADRVTQALLRAKERGCDVVVIMDYIGSLDYKWRSELESAKIPVVLFNPFPWSFWTNQGVPRSVGPVPFRDHRKILIADQVGFCGSMNVQGETVPIENEEYPGFYDLNAKITGPAVAHLGNVFRDSLEESGVGITRPPIVCPSRTGHAYVQVLQSNVRKQRKAIQKCLAKQIREAEAEVRVASSYFVPPGFLKRALLGSRVGSRECKILVSGTTDFYPVPGDLMAQTHALSRFIKRPNTQVFLYSHSHMHAKFTSVDKLFVQIGSFNFDRFSARRNLESAIGVFDADVVRQVNAIHDRLAQQSNPARDDGLYFRNPVARLACWFAYFLLKTSGRNVFDGFDAYGSDALVNKESKEWTLFLGRPDVVATGFPLL
jgi:cardiolipin synthase